MQPILGAALLIVGIVVAIFAVIALSRPNGQRSEGGARQTAAEQSLAGTPTPSNTSEDSSDSSSDDASGAASDDNPDAAGDVRASVLILNNTDIQGLAARAAEELRAAGWTVTGTDNYDNSIRSTAAYYDPSDPVNESAAHQLEKQFPWIERVVPRFAELPDSPIVLVVNAAF